jgi:hypothetical protein
MPILSCAAAVAATIGLAACGGSSSDPGGTPSSERAAAEQKAVKFAKCMREHGIDAQTSTAPGGKGFAIRITKAAGGGEIGGRSGPPPQFVAAQRACARYRPAPLLEKLSPAQRAEMAQQALKFARCMRSHGVEVPDPGSGGVIQPRDVNPESPTFQAAQKACQGLAHNLPMKMAFGGPGAHGGGPPPKGGVGGESGPAHSGG